MTYLYENNVELTVAAFFAVLVPEQNKVSIGNVEFKPKIAIALFVKAFQFQHIQVF